MLRKGYKKVTLSSRVFFCNVRAAPGASPPGPICGEGAVSNQ
jgi:hypothetical protein